MSKSREWIIRQDPDGTVTVSWSAPNEHDKRNRDAAILRRPPAPRAVYLIADLERIMDGAR
jgi:hypothetical protein